MGITIEIEVSRIVVYNNINSIVYYRNQAERFQDFYEFKRQLEQYQLEHEKPTYSDILSMAMENQLTACIYHR